MKLIIITSPTYIVGEAFLIEKLLSLGIDRVHIRKPSYTEKDTIKLLLKISPIFYHRIVLHDYHYLALKYNNIGGIHINKRNPVVPNGYKGKVTASCHSLKEVSILKNKYNYVFLSPIFNSISKQGYKSAFTHEELLEANKNRIIDEKVYALGGVTQKLLRNVHDYGFGGAALLGDIWNRVAQKDFDNYILQIICTAKDLCKGNVSTTIGQH